MISLNKRIDGLNHRIVGTFRHSLSSVVIPGNEHTHPVGKIAAAAVSCKISQKYALSSLANKKKRHTHTRAF